MTGTANIAVHQPGNEYYYETSAVQLMSMLADKQLPVFSECPTDQAVTTNNVACYLVCSLG